MPELQWGGERGIPLKDGADRHACTGCHTTASVQQGEPNVSLGHKAGGSDVFAHI